MPESAPALHIEVRTGWPDDLQVLLRQYPREVWATHPNLGHLARFWLDIHNGFRVNAAILETSAADFREGRVTPERFRAEFAPRLRLFLSHLEGHHQIEDFQFFPTFSLAEPRLVRGFEVLETDHGSIHAAMDRLAAAGNGFLRSDAADRDAMLFAGDAFAGAGAQLIGMLHRHLDDEEDLIVPVILDRSESGLGL